MVYTLMKTISKRDFHSYVLRMRGRPSENFDGLFNDFNTSRWNCFEYKLLEAIIIRNNCSIALQREMEQHAHNVWEFKQHTAILKLIKHRQFFRNRKFSSKGCFQQEVNTKARCPLHFCTIEAGSVEVEWRFLEEHEHTIVQFFCGSDDRMLLEQR